MAKPSKRVRRFLFFLLLLWFGSMKMDFCWAWISSAQIYSRFFSCAQPNIQVPPWCRGSCPARGDVPNAVPSLRLPNQTKTIHVFICIPAVWCPRHRDSSCCNNKEFSVIASRHFPPCSLRLTCIFPTPNLLRSLSLVHRKQQLERQKLETARSSQKRHFREKVLTQPSTAGVLQRR